MEQLIAKAEREARIARLDAIAGRCGTRSLECGRSMKWEARWQKRCDAVLKLIRRVHRGEC